MLKDGALLLVRRAAEPFKDYWDIPGGFIEPLEHPEACARREVMEETGLEIRIKKLLGVYPDTYGNEPRATLNFYFVAEAVGGTEQAASDATALCWFRLDELPDRIAFFHARRVLDDLRENLLELIST